MTDTVTDRFYAAVADLIMAGKLDDKDIPEHGDAVTPELLSWIVTEYGVSANWLLTGRGWTFGL